MATFMEKLAGFGKKLGWCVVDAFKKLPFAFYCLIHPFQGFYELKNDPRRKSVNTAILLYILLAVSAVLRKLMLGYLFVDSVYEQLNVNILIEVATAVLPYLLWTIANWCFTSLMDGDGKFVDIFVATAVALIPLIITNFISIPLSHYLSLDSSATFTTISTLGYVLAYIEIFFGMITIHQYSVSKGLVTAILSVLGILIIAFLMVLIYYLCQQVVGFVSQIYEEIAFRLNE